MFCNYSAAAVSTISQNVFVLFCQNACAYDATLLRMVKEQCCTMLQAALAAKNIDKPPAESSSTTKSKSKRKSSESKECEIEAPITKKEQVKPKLTKEKEQQAKPKLTKDKGNKLQLDLHWRHRHSVCY